MNVYASARTDRTLELKPVSCEEQIRCELSAVAYRDQWHQKSVVVKRYAGLLLGWFKGAHVRGTNERDRR